MTEERGDALIDDGAAYIGRQVSGSDHFQHVVMTSVPDCLVKQNVAPADAQWIGVGHYARLQHAVTSKSVKPPTLHTYIHPFNGPLSGTTQASRYQKGKTNLDFTEARDSEWQWHQLGHMQVCTWRETDNQVSTRPLSFLQAGCPSCTQPTASVHWRPPTLSESISQNAGLCIVRGCD